MSSRSLRPAVTAVAPILLAAVLFVVQGICTLPGELIDDSREQLREALSQQYYDWHPPVMALTWSWLIRLTGSAGSLLALHQFLHWLGIGLIADACQRIGRRREAWLVLAAGAFPLFLFYDRIVVKDVGMASALVAATGMIAWFVLQRRCIPIWIVLLSALCLLYGVLIRTNAVFAIGPLLLLYFLRDRWLGLPKLIAWSLLVAVLAVPLSSWINHRVIGARPQFPLQSLQLFDLMGIAVFSGDDRVLGDSAPPLAQVRDCYTSYWWDPVSPWGTCPALRRELGYTRSLDTTSADTLAATGRLWRAAIRAHPLAYAAHRAAFFNSSLYFVVPALQFRYSRSAELAPYGSRVITAHDIRLDYFKNNFLFWPVVWLYVGLGALLLLAMALPAASPAPMLVGRLLISSGLLFAGAYLLIGVASEFRYYYWTIMAVLLGSLVASRELISVVRARKRAASLVFAGLLLIITVGLMARIVDVRFV